MPKKMPPEDRQYYELRSILGVDAMFYILLGSREAGKSYAVMDFFLKKWKEKGIPFYWLRIAETSTQKLLENKAQKFIDPDLLRKYNLELTTKGCQVYDHGKPMAKVLSLASMAKSKGVAFYDKDFLNDPNMWYHICLDEFQLEQGEKKTHFNIMYNLINQLENLIRSSKERVRIFLVGNTLENASDVLVNFNFIPEEFGRYQLKKKRAIIEYMAPTKAYLERRKGTAGDILAGDTSNFTNKLIQDKTRLFKGRLLRPTAIIKFSKDPSNWFVLWNRNVIAEYRGETAPNVVAMRPYINEQFIQDARDSLVALYDARGLWFKNMITMKKFEKHLQELRPRK